MSDTSAAAVFASAEQTFARGDVTTAIKLYLDAFARDPVQPAYRRAALDSLNKLDRYPKLPKAVIAGLERCVDDPTLDLQPLARVVKNLLLDHPSFAPIAAALDSGWQAFDEAVGTGAFDDFFTNKLLLATLNRAGINMEPAERALTRLRRAVLHAPAVLARHRPFVEAMANHNIRTRHMWTEVETEQAELKSVTAPSADQALLHCLYHAPDTLSAAQQALLPHSIQKIIANRAEEQHIAASLPAFTAISPGLSAEMQAQYEAYPYPLWEQYSASEPSTWDAFLKRFIPAPLFELPQPPHPEVLIAGCGTGRFCIDFARYQPSARITATDLSRTSLSYAVRKAREAGIPNVNFGIGDILRLRDLKQRFHFIECGGVLHHMADPLAGLKALTDVLLPGGVMCIALYSERARVPIVEARNFVAQRQFPDTIAGMRAMRQAIFALPEDEPVRRITRRMDFYWADGLHDLVFNLHEMRYTPRGIKTLVADAGLAFLGFEINNPTRWATYKALNPDDPLGRDLDAWDAFEKNHSDTFIGMLQFWLQKPA